ncbi:MAG TPA: hypothetical protein VF817_01395 [Patescibacteria group bacterium]
MKEREGHMCVNPNTCDICQGLVREESLEDSETKVEAKGEIS